MSKVRWALRPAWSGPPRMTWGLAVLWAASCGGDGPAGPEPAANRSPVAAFTVSADTGEPPFAVTFDGSSSADPDGTIASYTWSFGDGGMATGVGAEHTYQDSGNFEATLTVTDNLGAQATANTTVTVLDLPEDQIRGSVWFDVDGNGSRAPGEVGAPGLRVFIDSNQDGLLNGSEQFTTTDEMGRYRLEGLTPGLTYRVSQQLGIGWRNTLPGPGVTMNGIAPGAIVHAGPAARIIDGTDASISDFPWMVALVVASVPDNQLAHFCGGSLIAPRWVLTAAHCIVDFGTGQIEVLAGTDTLSSGGTRVGVVSLHVHPFYVDGASFKSDLGLIELSADLPGPYSFMPVATLGEIAQFTQVVTTGWGRTVAGVAGSSPALQVTTIPVISNTECAQIYGELLDETMLCAGFLLGGTSPCQGDSGGPLFLDSGGITYQIGITSWGVVNCGRPNAPNVFARVLALMEFAEEVVPVESSGSFMVELTDLAATGVDFGNAH